MIHYDFIIITIPCNLVIFVILYFCSVCNPKSGRPGVPVLPGGQAAASRPGRGRHCPGGAGKRLDQTKRGVVRARGLLHLVSFCQCFHSESVFVYIPLNYFDFCASQTPDCLVVVPVRLASLVKHLAVWCPHLSDSLRSSRVRARLPGPTRLPAPEDDIPQL